MNCISEKPTFTLWTQQIQQATRKAASNSSNKGEKWDADREDFEDVLAAVGAIACLFVGGNAIGDFAFPLFEGGLACSVVLLLISRPAVLQTLINLEWRREFNHWSIISSFSILIKQREPENYTKGFTKLKSRPTKNWKWKS